jgi:aminoglycoside 3-N-acetyltransferase I
MSVRVQRLSPPQLPSFRQLIALFGRAFHDPETYSARPPSDAYLEALLSRMDVVVIVALDGGTVVGGLVAYVLPKFEQERSEVYLYDLAVDEGHRRRGIARDLILELRTVAAALGAWVIFVQADTGAEDLPAVRLYESLGAREEVLHFDISVGEAR